MHSKNVMYLSKRTFLFYFCASRFICQLENIICIHLVWTFPRIMLKILFSSLVLNYMLIVLLWRCWMCKNLLIHFPFIFKQITLCFQEGQCQAEFQKVHKKILYHLSTFPLANIQKVTWRKMQDHLWGGTINYCSDVVTYTVYPSLGHVIVWANRTLWGVWHDQKLEKHLHN